MRVEYRYQAGGEWETDDGEMVDLPPRNVWLFLCDEHGEFGEGIYTAVEVRVEDFDRLDKDQYAAFLVVQWEMAAMDMRSHGCDHEIPGVDKMMLAKLGGAP